MNEVSEKIHNIVATQLGVNAGEVKDNLYLKDDLNADPLAIADITVTLEEEFTIEIPQEDSLKFNTVGDIVTYVSEHLNEL